MTPSLRPTPSALLAAACVGAFAVAVAAAAPQAGPKPAPPATPPAVNADTAAVRALVESFAQAYNRRDADAVAALFTDDARIFDESGRLVEGRAAIRERFAAAFAAAAPGVTVRLKPGTIRFLTPDVAVEDGTALVEPPKPEPGAAPADPPPPNDYTATHVRRGGAWLTAEVRDRPAPPSAGGKDEGDQALEELGWLAGEWVDEDDQGIVHTTARWSADHHYLLRDYHVKLAGRPAADGTQRIGWDPVRGKVRSWAFDSDGGFTEGVWTRVAPGRWVIKTEGYLRDGRLVSATNTLAQVSRDAYRWGSTDRVVGEDEVADVEESLIVRRPPAPSVGKK